MAALLLVFNDGTSVTTATEAAVAVAVYLTVGYLAFTAIDLLLERFWWAN